MKGFKNVKAYIYGTGIIQTNIGIENGIITYIGNDNKKITDPLDIDGILVPGFIDEHIHGAGNFDSMDISNNSINTISKTLAKEGTTSFLATTMTQSVDSIKNSLINIKSSLSQKINGAELIGIHLEGPFLSSEYKGAHLEDFIIDPNIELLNEFMQLSNNLIKIVTYAPEKDVDFKFLNYLINNNIIASAGHSSATYDIINKASKLGLNSITHTYNAQSKLHHREIGIVGCALLIDELYTEIICDLIHISIPAIQLLIKNKPKDKIILITDSIKAKGIDINTTDLGGQTVTIKNGKATLKDGTIAGSVLKMNDAIKNLVTKVNIPFEDAINYATYNPAKHLGIIDQTGTIEVGKKANLTVLNENYNITLTMVNGKIVYKK